MSSSDCWVLKGLKDALAFELIEKGYDVWLGNARGNPYGKHHVKRAIDEQSFWNFSFHEIGVIDLPTIIDYVLQQTQQSALHYVGHSQGTTTMFILLSMRPKYNNKLKSLHMMAPIAFLQYTRSPLVILPQPFVGTHTPLDSLLGYAASLYQPIVGQVYKTCTSPASNRKFCSFLASLVNGGYSDYTQEVSGVIDKH